MRDRQEDVDDLVDLEEEVLQWISEEEPDPDVEEAPHVGRKKIPEQWSRVISLSRDNLVASRSFPVGPDLLKDAALVGSLQMPAQSSQWKPLFWLRDFLLEHEDMTLLGNQLDEDAL